MPARVLPDTKLCITTWRSNDIVDVLLAATGEQAATMARTMLDELGPLQDGDKITVVAVDAKLLPQEQLPEASRASHTSG